jgi:23S rRNA (uracil1939-C5)-methyltransferase
MSRETLTITALGHRGDGVAQTPGGPVYVPFALPGEVVEVEAVPGHPDRRVLCAVTVPSPDRIGAHCPHFSTCGGCAIQHWPHDLYLAWKRDLVVRALADAGIEAPVGPILDAHGQGRRRVTLHARWGTREILEVGFTAQRSHHVIGIDQCPILAPGLSGAIAAAWALAEQLAPVRKPVDIAITATATGLDVDLRGTGPLPPRRVSELAALAGRHGLARLTRHGELIIQHRPPEVTMGRAQVALPPGGFLQATAEGEAALARLVGEALSGARRIADLFSGCGPFTLRLAETAQILAADSEAPAIAALGRAAQMTTGLKPVRAVARDLFRRPLLAPELAEFDAVVLDPPRQGAQAQAGFLAKSKVARIAMVSCNPTTFARDAKLLTDGGYRLEAVTPVDQFRHSAHVELVGLFKR